MCAVTGHLCHQYPVQSGSEIPGGIPEGSGGFIRISIRSENLPAKNEKKTAGEKDPDSLMEQYFQMLVSSGTITMREFLMMQGLMDIIMEHCPAERKHSAVKDAVHRISRIIKEGK